MSSYTVTIKHAGKTYPLSLDTTQPPPVFKQAIFEVTGVPVDRMKVMIKGGFLKDDADWSKVSVKANQTFTVIGAAGPLPKAPEKPIVFLEDMDESELAAIAMPSGLANLGNTCYMNATVQALRAVPELQIALGAAPGALPALPGSLRDLYAEMGRTTDGVTPYRFLSVLRQVAPQFGEMDRREGHGMRGYAQQDAEECWNVIANGLKDVPGLPGPEAEQTQGQAAAGAKFVEQYLMGRMMRKLTCDEAPDEPPSVLNEEVMKIECNISASTSFLASGIKAAMDQKVEKTSPSLGREAVYTQHSRLSRLPSYLVVHMVRFEWRRDIGKKAKIMRKVKFPTEFDALDLVTDDLRKELAPVATKLKELERDRAERRKVRKRTKNVPVADGKGKQPATDVEMMDAAGPSTTAAAPADAAVGTEDVVMEVQGGELAEESTYRDKELKELEALVSPALRRDVGCSVTGLYDLVAIVTHKGAAADAGHYMGFVKKSVFHPVASHQAGAGAAGGPKMIDEDDEDWYKFDDDKVSLFPKEKLGTLDGGGEDSSAYVLMYKSKSLA